MATKSVPTQSDDTQNDLEHWVLNEKFGIAIHDKPLSMDEASALLRDARANQYPQAAMLVGRWI